MNPKRECARPTCAHRRGRAIARFGALVGRILRATRWQACLQHGHQLVEVGEALDGGVDRVHHCHGVLLELGRLGQGRLVLEGEELCAPRASEISVPLLLSEGWMRVCTRRASGAISKILRKKATPTGSSGCAATRAHVRVTSSEICFMSAIFVADTRTPALLQDGMSRKRSDADCVAGWIFR